MKNEKIVKYVLYAIEILLLFILQSTPHLMPKIFGVTPMLIAPAIITLSFFEDEIPSLLIGLIGGIAMDISFGQHFGLFGIIMTMLCLIAPVCFHKKIKITLLSAIILGAAVLAVTVFLDFIFRYVLMGYSHPILIVVEKFIPIYFYSLLCMPILYLINFGIFMALRSPDEA